LLPELRPVPCDRVVQGQLAPLGQLVHEQRVRPTPKCAIEDHLSVPQHGQLRDDAASPHQVDNVGQCRCIDANIFW
jgi:hypothetical protein